MEHRYDTLAPDARVARIATAQYGVIRFDQLRGAGLGVGAINSRVRAGRLHRIHVGVFAVGHTRLSRDGRWLAAIWALGADAVLSHTSAAALWGIRGTSAATIHVTVPTSAGHPNRRGIAVHRSRTLLAADVTMVDGIPVTSVARTLLDIAGMLAPGPLERAVEHSLRLRLFDLTHTRAVLQANPRRKGASNLARIIATIHDEPTLTRSQLENLMRDLCDAHRIPRPQVNVIVDGKEVDFFWRAQRLIVETDGHETHGTRSAFENDRAKDARLTVLGYRVVRFTYRQLVYEPQTVTRTLRALIAPPPA
jgi:very-short-patch-repair endonuclease